MATFLFASSTRKNASFFLRLMWSIYNLNHQKGAVRVGIRYHPAPRYTQALSASSNDEAR